MEPQSPLSRVEKKEPSGPEHARQKPKQPDPEEFRKMLDDEASDQDSGKDKNIAKERKEEVAMTPFDLVAGAKLTKGKQAPFALMAGKDADLQEASTDLVAIGEGESQKATPQSQMRIDSFAQDRPDLTYVNPTAMNIQPQGGVAISAQAAPQAVDRASLQALAQEMIDKLLIVKKDGQTDTVLTLNKPPVLAGAELVVTKYDTAQKEFNIAFHGLSPDGKRLLDLHANQLALQNAIRQAGEDYTVHIVTVSPEPYEKRLQTFHEGQTRGSRNPEDQSDNQSRGGGGGKKGRKGS